MGIRFRCHHCEHELHVKDFQAGKRGRCPECQGRFRIPAADAEHSLALENLPSARSFFESKQPQPVHAAQATEIKKSSRTAEPRSKSEKPKLQKSKPQPAAPLPSSPADRGHGDADRGHGDHASTPDASPVAGSPPGQLAALPSTVSDFPHSIWHVRPAAGGQYGPAPADVFMQWLIEGRVDQQAWVWRDDWQDWQQAGLVFSEFYQASLPTSPAPTSGPPNSPPKSPPPVPPLASVRQPAATPISTLPTGEAPAASLAEPANPRLERRRKQRQRNIVIVSVLAVLFVGLLVALGVVLFSQSGGA